MTETKQAQHAPSGFAMEIAGEEIGADVLVRLNQLQLAKIIHRAIQNSGLIEACEETADHLEAIETWMDANMPDESDGGNALAASINMRVQELRAAIAKARGQS